MRRFFHLTDRPLPMRKFPCRLRYLLFLASSLLIVAPGFSADTAEEFRFATEGYRYAFPRDHGAHEEFRTEWWYYTGQVTTTVSYTHLRAHETPEHLVCRLL